MIFEEESIGTPKGFALSAKSAFGCASSDVTRALNKNHFEAITNDLPSGLVLSFHCLSQDDDMGTMLLAPGDQWGFRFHLNIGGGTLFHCGFTWFGAKMTYRCTVYDDSSHKSECINCFWSIRINGACLASSSIHMVFCTDW
ncbi:hypothetical protein MLD38_036561 [Melastoma candidum]|uniref:Uncharacterized protein n=1 Tax=Melastoma candidum TaxID=119954 RepID=A0ACB9LK25_9MYRT|nr:hypothetical protein MLD38_036561 [Melastoma candidum]